MSDEEFERTLRFHAPAVAALLRRTSSWTGKSPDLQADALQEALARAWAARRRFDPSRPFGPWLATIAIRVARDLERGRRRRPDGVSLGAAVAVRSGERASEVAAPEAGPDAALVRREELLRLERALAELPEPPRRAFLAFHRDGRSLNEIAAEMGLPLNTLKSHLRRARQRLARELGGDA